MSTDNCLGQFNCALRPSALATSLGRPFVDAVTLDKVHCVYAEDYRVGDLVVKPYEFVPVLVNRRVLTDRTTDADPDDTIAMPMRFGYPPFRKDQQPWLTARVETLHRGSGYFAERAFTQRCVLLCSRYAKYDRSSGLTLKLHMDDRGDGKPIYLAALYRRLSLETMLDEMHRSEVTSREFHAEQHRAPIVCVFLSQDVRRSNNLPYDRFPVCHSSVSPVGQPPVVHQCLLRAESDVRAWLTTENLDEALIDLRLTEVDVDPYMVSYVKPGDSV